MNIEEIHKIAEIEKKNIIQHREGPAIIIAGPGTGKTTVLAERVISLCEECDPTHVVAITFTNKAAEEVKIKVESICKELKREYLNLRISTIHSFTKRLLHHYSERLDLSSSFRILGSIQEKILLEDLRCDFKTHKINLGHYKDRYLTRFKASRAFVPSLSLDKFAKIPFNNKLAAQEEFNAYYRYLLDYYHSIDWYDVVSLAVDLLHDNIDILEEVSGEIDHLLVDEYQDLNRADHQLIHLLATNSKSFIAFGDDDQSIYQTGRFANPNGVKRFTAVYPEAKFYSLSICWRCGSAIIDNAWKLINVDEDRLPGRQPKEKPIADPTRGSGEFEITSFKSEKQEKKELCVKVIDELSSSPSPESILILFHTRKIGQKYANDLQANGLQFVNLLSKFLADSEAVFLLYEILRLLNDESDNLAVRFLLQELFNLKPNWIANVRRLSMKQNKHLWQTFNEIDDPAVKKIKTFSKNIEAWRKMENIIEVLNEIIEFLKINNEPEIQRFMEWCKQESTITISKLIECIERGTGFEESRPKEGTADATVKITVMTMHGAKGLTSDVVFIPALEDEFMPNDWYEPEQRRLLYVSMTRAKRRLLLSWAWSRTGKDTYRTKKRSAINRKRSRFLIEIEG